MTTTQLPKLICPECRRENEAERIYCHDCGTRLDRTALAKLKPKETDDPKATQRRVKAMFNGRRVRIRQTFFNLAKLILAALVVAAFVQMFRAPEMPESKTQIAELPPQINLDLGNAAMDAKVPALRYSQEQIDAYLASVVKSRKAAMNQYLTPDRIVVSFDEGLSRVFVQRSLFGYGICTSANVAPQIRAGAVSGKVTGAWIGRLPIHPLLLPYTGYLFADVRKALEREEKSVAKLGALELHPQQIVISRAPAT